MYMHAEFLHNTRGSSSLGNLLPNYPHLQNAKPVYLNFCAGDIRLSLADISKAASLLGYKPNYRIDGGLKVAMQWYVKHITVRAKA